MALPPDFWHNDQQLNIFRTKSCQRLARDGVCEWKTRCQFSHTVDWPRRPPQKVNYSPVLCPYVQFGADCNKDSSISFTSQCRAGLSCQFAHSLEEVLYHPSFFKTILCEEYTSNSQRGSRRAKRGRCHRYYCPFAHSERERRTTDLSPEVHAQCRQALERCPALDEMAALPGCQTGCKVCRVHRFCTPASGMQKEDAAQRHQRLSGSQLSTSGSSASSSPQLRALPPPGTFLKEAPSAGFECFLKEAPPAGFESFLKEAPSSAPPPPTPYQQAVWALHLQSLAGKQPLPNSALAAFAPPMREPSEAAAVAAKLANANARAARQQPPAAASQQPALAAAASVESPPCPFLLPPAHYETTNSSKTAAGGAGAALTKASIPPAPGLEPIDTLRTSLQYSPAFINISADGKATVGAKNPGEEESVDRKGKIFTTL